MRRSVSGFMGSVSPFLSAPLMSTTNGRSVFQTPERSGLPSAVLGVGPVGTAFPRRGAASCPAAGTLDQSRSAAAAIVTPAATEMEVDLLLVTMPMVSFWPMRFTGLLAVVLLAGCGARTE